jgi:ubiquitin fusion degradation protein 1
MRMNTNSDKIILPASILEILISMEVQYPLTFEIVTNQKKTHCGVLEFTSDEGTCFIPQWIMKNLELKEGDNIYIRNVALTQATFIKFKPCLSFLEISDPRAVLEYILRSFSCVTIGDNLQFDYNFKTYHLEVIEVLPKKACCIIESDIEVEFEEPDTKCIQEFIQECIQEPPKAFIPLPISGTEIKESTKSTKSTESTESKENKLNPTKWSKLSKMAHFQGKGNKTGK